MTAIGRYVTVIASRSTKEGGLKKGYSTVSLPLRKDQKLTLYTSGTVVKAAHEITAKLDDMYYGTKLRQVIEAVYERGRVDGRAEVISKLDALKKATSYRLPGRPPKSN